MSDNVGRVKFRLSQLARLVPSRYLDRLVPDRLFSRLDIAGKMLFGYLILVLCTVMVAAYALTSLQRLNRLNSSIVTVDVNVQKAADAMLEAIIAQDSYEKRYLILNSREMQQLFLNRGEEFRVRFDAIRHLPLSDGRVLDRIDALHQEYTDLFSREVKLLQGGRNADASRISNGALKNASEEIIGLLRELSGAAEQSQEAKMQRISRIGRTAFLVTAALSLLGIVLAVGGSLVVTHHISSSIGKLKEATRQIAEGNFSYDPQIRNSDEVGALASSFVEMGGRLRKLEEMYLDASPLTRLPGNIAIENVIKKRLGTGRPFAFCLIDLDNFKSYNDRYGYARGSELLKETAHILEDTVAARGAGDDFLGHIGGDDFVVITVPQRMREICDEIIARFDRRVPDFYDEADRRIGHILGRSRHGEERRFPILTISIAIVTNERRTLEDPLKVSEIAAELKDYAKAMPKSVYVIDKRRSS
jgi:GGDEF domain-containing protein/CHASE3 domain sensor protein